MKHLIAPSILAADFGNLQKEISLINSSNADLFHIDVMDGVFVPNISFGFPVLKVVKEYAQKPLDVHLMITQPERFLESFAKAGANILTVHFEACTHLHRTIEVIKNLKCKVGVAINPATPVNLLQDVIADLDLVLIMSVNPGFGGQKFIHHSYQKIKQVRKLADELNPKLLIEVDGGVDENNVAELIRLGANVIVAGSSIFNAPDSIKAIDNLKNPTTRMLA